MNHEVCYVLGQQEVFDKYMRKWRDFSVTHGATVFKDEISAVWYHRQMRKKGKLVSGFTVYGVEADWEKDTLPVEGEIWRELKRSAKVFVPPIRQSNLESQRQILK